MKGAEHGGVAGRSQLMPKLNTQGQESKKMYYIKYKSSSYLPLVRVPLLKDHRERIKKGKTRDLPKENL